MFMQNEEVMTNGTKCDCILFSFGETWYTARVTAKCPDNIHLIFDSICSIRFLRTFLHNALITLL